MREHKSLLHYIIEAIDHYHAERRAVTTETEMDAQPQRLSSRRRLLRWMMPNGGTLLLIVVLILTQNVWARTEQSATNAPGPSATTVNYQGRLADSGGAPLDGTYGMSFALYDALTAGSMVWGPENHTAVPVSEGLFSVGLGSLTGGGIPTSVWDGDRYLEITVGGETLSPRELIRSVPIAGMALTVPDGSIFNQKLALSYWKTNPSGTVTSSDESAPDEIVYLDVDFPVDSVYLIFAKVISYADSPDSQLIAEIWDENGKIGYVRTVNSHSQAGVGGRQTSTIVTIMPFSAGLHTIKLVAFMDTDTTGHIGGHSELIVIPLGE
jgi:hypothetical protein